MKNNEPVVLICTRLEDMTLMHPEQTNELCSMCQHAVGVYPTGQRAIKEFPSIKIVCSVCVDPFGEEDTVYSVGSVDEIVKEKKESKPVGRA